MDTTWMARGNCRDEPPSRFFPSDGVGVELARRICRSCPVKDPCLEYALDQRVDHGVWGGASERERRRILKRRRDAVSPVADPAPAENADSDDGYGLNASSTSTPTSRTR